MNGGGGGRSVIGEFDPCEMDEDLMLMNSSSTNGGTALDSTSESSATTATMPHDIMDLETDTGLTAATLKQTSIKQNGKSTTMSIVHSYNYTGKQCHKISLSLIQYQ